MRYLFLHPNFPGQLLRPALLASQLGHEVKFLCHTHFGRSLKGVERVTLKGELGESALDAQKLKGDKRTLALAEQFLTAMQSLAKSGWKPDVVVSHSGFGCGLHSSLVWPKAKRIAYVEWWFATHAALYNFDPDNSWWEGPSDGYSIRSRNMPLALELSEADELVTPTRWQRQQLPTALQARCKVIPDGVDLNRFRRDPLQRAAAPLLTYGTRGMEPMRGFPEFIEALPPVLEAHPSLNVEIAGEDRICYGGSPPKEGSYGRWANKRLKRWIDKGQVKFIGRVAPHEYPDWLRRSWMHVHLSRPFVASWSLLEAMAAGCCLIASNTEPVREFVDSKSAALVDFRTEQWLNPVVTALLADRALAGRLAETAAEMAKKFDERRSGDAWSRILVCQNADRAIA